MLDLMPDELVFYCFCSDIKPDGLIENVFLRVSMTQSFFFQQPVAEYLKTG